MALNNRMKEVQKAALSDEKHTIQLLQRIYEQAAKDTEAKIAALNARTDLQNIQSIVYQKQYQEALKKQLDGIINDLHTQSFTTVSEYLGKSYEHGFYGALYDLHGQGVPFLFPIRQDEVVKALNNDYSNIAKTQRGKDIYKRMGENTDYLKKAVRAEVSRGIANGSSWLDMASHVAKGMNSPFNRAMNRAFLITRTEGHRVQNQATVDVQKRAKDLGADVVKQWDATLDANTRPWHADADGQIREIDEEFDVGGEKMKAPGIGGSARNVCNCRCVLLQRAKWALNKNETKYLGDVSSMTDKQKEDIAKKLGVSVDDLPNISKSIVPIHATDYNEFKEKAVHSEAYNSIIDICNTNKVKYNEVKPLKESLPGLDIIEKLAGGDQTAGSCSSLAFSYIGNKNGLDVTDFRGGISQKVFSQESVIETIAKLPGVNSSLVEVDYEAKGAAEVLREKLIEGKEYYLSTGRHAAIVRKVGDEYQYLELQSAIQNGWMPFDKYGSMVDTLMKRFGCRKTKDQMKIGGKNHVFKKPVVLMDSDSFNGNEEFQEILGYINTATDKQKKGKSGGIR